MLIDIVKAIILGIIEGITEFLPISSTGHLYLADYLVKLNQPSSFINMFMVVIQLGAILSVILIYFDKLNPFSKNKNKQKRKETWNLWFKVVVAVIPAAVIGLPLNDWLEAHMSTWPVIASTLIVYGILFILLENYCQHNQANITKLGSLSYQMAILIGCFQVLSLIPGTSRSGATILGALLLGASRYVSTEFSFFLAIPTMLGATGLKIIKMGFAFTLEEWLLILVGSVVSFVVAYAVITKFMKFIKKNDFKVFGIYRIILGILVLLFV